MKKNILLLSFIMSTINGFTQNQIYWVESGFNPKIIRADLDGSNAVNLIDSGLISPRGLAIDTSGQKMYWTDLGSKKIQRANLDGSGFQDLVTIGLDTPYGIALNFKNNKMYWTDYGTKKIQRSNFDGTNVEDIITTGIINPRGIAIDTNLQEMFWADFGYNIMRADLDGTNAAIFIPGGGGGDDNFDALSIDITGDTMFWSTNDDIYVATISPTSSSVLTPGFITIKPHFLAIDYINNKILFSDSTNNIIWSINKFDGFQSDTVITTNKPQGIAIVQDVVSSIVEYKHNTILKIYPNPATDKIFIKDNFDKPALFELYDITGRKVLEQTLTGINSHVYINHLSKGFYIYKLETEKDGYFTGKLIKQ